MSLPPGVDPADLAIACAGDTLVTYYQAEPLRFQAVADELGCFSLVERSAGGGLPLSGGYLRLAAGYPNPSPEAGALVLAEIRSRQSVTLRIYDASGRLVATPVKGEVLMPGEHTLRWDGRDGEGERAPSGIYLARLESAAGTSKTVKLVRLRRE